MKPLKEYIKKDEYHTYYEDPETGVHFDDLGSLLQSQILGHCGCGKPDENLILMYDMLKMLERHRKESALLWNDKEDNEKKWSKLCEYHDDEIREYIHDNWQKFAYFFYYVMDDKEIMEHGGSVPGWICDDNFMEAIQLWKEEYDKRG